MGEIYLINSHIPLYKQSSYNNHDPKNERKLLLNRKEINKLIGRINQEGLTIVPTKMYFKREELKLKLQLLKEKSYTIKDKLKKKRDWQKEQSRLLRKNK